MPSIPQSLLWIALVVLWLFVLVPMLINKRDTVRRTSDVALATRVLNGGVKSRLMKRGGPASGHRHDPAWQPDDEFDVYYPDIDESLAAVGDHADNRTVVREYDDAVRRGRIGVRSRSVVVVAAVTEQRLTEGDYLDVDVVEESSAALPIGETRVRADMVEAPPRESAEALVDPEEDSEAEPAPAAHSETEAVESKTSERRAERAVVEQTAEAEPETNIDEREADMPKAEKPASGEYEYVDDTAGLEFDEQPEAPVTARSASRARRLSNSAEAAVSARKYRFRKRVLMTMSALILLSVVLSSMVSPKLWWSCGAMAGLTILYLGYLRRQTSIEEQIRRRRQQRMARSRPVVQESVLQGPEVDVSEFPTRLQRPGAVVLEIDDEDPAFDHLDEIPYSRRHYGRGRYLPRASGQ